MQGLPYELLVDLAEGRLPAQEAATLRTQLASDPAAAAELTALETLIDLMRSDQGEDAPEHVIARAARLVRSPSPTPAPNLLQPIIAMLRGDSWQMPLAAGLRAGSGAPRSLAYSAEAWDVDLQLDRQPGGWQLRGQLLGPELTGSVVLNGGEAPITAEISELGEFALPPLQAGIYTLQLQLGERTIVIEQLELGP